MSNEYKSELSPSEDIVKWLRDERYDVCDRNMRCNGEVMEEAADEIEQLREKSKADEELKDKAAKMIEELRLRNDRLRATLKMITSKTHSTIYEI